MVDKIIQTPLLTLPACANNAANASAGKRCDWLQACNNPVKGAVTVRLAMPHQQLINRTRTRV